MLLVSKQPIQCPIVHTSYIKSPFFCSNQMSYHTFHKTSSYINHIFQISYYECLLSKIITYQSSIAIFFLNYNIFVVAWILVILLLKQLFSIYHTKGVNALRQSFGFREVSFIQRKVKLINWTLHLLSFFSVSFGFRNVIQGK